MSRVNYYTYFYLRLYAGNMDIESDVTLQNRRVVLHYNVTIVVGVQAITVGGCGGGGAVLNLSHNQGAGIRSGANQELLAHVLDAPAADDIAIGVH